MKYFLLKVRNWFILDNDWTLTILEVLWAVEVFRWKLTAVWMQDTISGKKLRIRDEDSLWTIIEQKLESEKIDGINKCREIPMKVENYQEAINFFEHLWFHSNK